INATRLNMKILAAILVFCLSGLVARAQVNAADLAGNWAGVLDFQEVKLRLVFRLVEDGSGLKATLDSLDQGARGIPVDTVSLENSTLRLEIKAIQGSYQGQVNSAGSFIDGTWEHGGKAVPLDLQRAPDSFETDPPLSGEALTASRQAALMFSGVWKGTIGGSERNTPVRFKIWRAGGGAARGTLDIAGQQIFNLPLKEITLREGKLRVEVPGIGAAFAGQFESDTNRVQGEWRQAGKTQALDLRKAPPREP
ncbi:MAG TPA: hypothetical protein VN673_19470, partial [Clostridia bacterium]|nr:hypothetical protein [Clostridia bacterium]